MVRRAGNSPTVLRSGAQRRPHTPLDHIQLTTAESRDCWVRPQGRGQGFLGQPWRVGAGSWETLEITFLEQGSVRPEAQKFF